MTMFANRFIDLHRTAACRKRLYDTKAENRKFPVGSCSAQVGLSLDWTSSSRSSGHRSYRWYPEKPIGPISQVGLNPGLDRAKTWFGKTWSRPGLDQVFILDFTTFMERV